MPYPDLITLAVAQSALTEVNLSAGQQQYLPTAITNASAAIRGWCQERVFSLWAFDEVRTPLTDNYILTRQYPIQPGWQAWSGRTTGLQITNTNTTANQYALVSYTYTGTVDTGIVYTGINLDSSSNGVDTNIPILYASLAPPTLNSLAAAVNTLGAAHGWNAQVQTPYGGWGCGKLVMDNIGQMDGFQGAYLELFATPLTGARLSEDGRGQVIDLRYSNNWITQSNFVWPGSMGYLPTQPNGQVLPPQCRIQYTAGFSVIPGIVQECTCEAVKLIFERLKRPMMLQSESDAAYTWAGISPKDIEALPLALRQQLAKYRYHQMS